jgi:hypothetical protein
MPTCKVCMRMYHPDWCFEQTIRGDDVIVCTFCRLDKQVLTVENEDGTVKETVTKDEASRDYLKYLDDLSRKPEIAKIIAKDK